MKATLLLLPSLMVLGQAFAAASTKKGSFVDHCKEKGNKKGDKKSARTPTGPSVYRGFRELGLDANELTPNTGTLPAGGPMRFVVKSSCAKPPIKKEDRYLLFIRDGGDLIHLTMEVEGRVWSAVTPPLDPGMVGLLYIDTFEGRDAKGWSLAEYEKAKKARSGGIHLKTIVHWKVEEPDLKTDKITEDRGQLATHVKDSDISDFTCVDYKEADARGAKYPREEVKSLRQLAKDLTSPFTSHVLKARALFTWVTTNIAYDHATLVESVMHKSAEKVVRAGMGSCQGYTALFEKLAQYAGLDVMYIVGAGRMPGEKAPQDFGINHAWNAVKINGRWRPIDCTWGSGKLIKDGVISGSGFNSEYFTSSPEVFRRTHFPEKPEEQFCPTVITYEQFKQQEEGPWFAVGKEEVGLNLQEVKPNLKRIPAGKPTRFEVKCRCSPIKPKDQYILVIMANGPFTPLKVGEDGCLWSIVLTPPKPGPVVLAYIDKFGDKSGKGLTMKEYEAPKRGTRRGIAVLAQWEAY